MAPLMWFERFLVAFMYCLCVAFDARCEANDARNDESRSVQDFGR